ncbi:MAG: hypothetical protein SFZ24_01400 [Planctomycetota bacterium]|nr:hypothetical protein [Planctomycetota bacterium]
MRTLVVAGLGMCVLAHASDASAPTARVSEGLGAALNANAALEALGADRDDKLAQRLGAMLDTWQSGTPADYAALMQSWGGKWRLEPMAYMREHAPERWHGAGDPCAVRELDWTRAVVSVIDGVRPDGVTHTDFAVNNRNSGGSGKFCVFEFGATTTFDLVQAGQPVVDVTVRGALVGGKTCLFSYRFVWEPASENWVPWTAFETPDSGNAHCMRMY